MASADSVLISERHDISLLKHEKAPPNRVSALVSGMECRNNHSAPFHGLHHPNGGIKKVAIEEGSLSIGSFDDPKYNMEPNSFWVVRDWETASTEGGSSGSPLLDKEKLIVGTLTGGVSQCSSTRGPDIYASLQKFWQVNGSLGNPNPISYYLDPQSSQTVQTNGLNPYASEPFTKSHNSTTKHLWKHIFNRTILRRVHICYTEFAEDFMSVQSQQQVCLSPSLHQQRVTEIPDQSLYGKMVRTAAL